MEAHIRYAPSVAPVLEGLVKAGLIELLVEEPAKTTTLTPEEIQARMHKLREASRVIAQNPNFYEEWKRDIDKMREEWD
jgi:hypothetical protein